MVGRFQRVRSTVVALVMVLAITACVGRPEEDATGEEIYLQLCSNCHSSDLSGNVGPSLGAGSNAANQPDTFLEMAIVDGRGRMPSFRNTLDMAQLERLIGFLRDAQGR